MKADRALAKLSLENRRRGLALSLPRAEQTLRGSWYLIETLAPGRTTRAVVPGEQLEQVRQWVENDQRMRQELESISAINRELLRRKRPGSQKSSKKRHGRWKSIFTFVALPTGKACLGNQVQKMERITTLEAKTLCIRLVRQLVDCNNHL